MSKKTLQKELALMNHSQLAEVILNAYDARKDFKEYFEYFLNPQPEKMLEKFKAAIFKELGRSSRGRSKARISRIRQYIADFKSFQPGNECISDIYISTISGIATAEYRFFLPSPLVNGVSKLISEYVVHSDISETISECQKNLEAILSSRELSVQFSKFIRRSIADAFECIGNKQL